jgi:hypothetical protein
MNQEQAPPMDNKNFRLWQLQDLPFWVLFAFVFIGAVLEIAYNRFDLLTSLIPIITGMIIYVIFKKHSGDQ